MNAIILAAGMGTRLRPLTNDRPKCLVAVNGVPMVERQIQFLKEKGIDDVTLISGYKAESLAYLSLNTISTPYLSFRYAKDSALYPEIKVTSSIPFSFRNWI